ATRRSRRSRALRYRSSRQTCIAQGPRCAAASAHTWEWDMKCERCQPLIEDYFDGELEQQIASQVSAHVETCSACSTLAAEIKLEREIYTRYHRDVDVTPELWANV